MDEAAELTLGYYDSGKIKGQIQWIGSSFNMLIANFGDYRWSKNAGTVTFEPTMQGILLSDKFYRGIYD